MRYSSQIRAARSLLGWSQDKLARDAGVGLTTLQRIEQNEGGTDAMFQCFETAGGRANPDSRVSMKPRTGASPRVDKYCTSTILVLARVSRVCCRLPTMKAGKAARFVRGSIFAC